MVRYRCGIGRTRVVSQRKALVKRMLMNHVRRKWMSRAMEIALDAAPWTSDAPCELHVALHDRHSLRVNSAEVPMNAQ